MPHVFEQTDAFLANLGLTNDQIAKVKDKAGQCVEFTLGALYPDAVDYPGAEAYSVSIKNHWSATACRDASAVFHPSSTQDVAKALEILTFFGQKFAIRGGGHSPNPGWAGIQGGLLISMDRIRTLAYNETTNVVSIGAGNRWGSVYEHLEKFGVLVTGGHFSPVGCVGQITGCGNSPWFHKYGWSCDNVLNFEIVTSGGRILNASRDENPDLWWALKGGSNNFGIVTRLDMLTIPFPDGVWGGQIRWPWSPEMQRKTVEAHYRFSTERIKTDPGCESLSAWGKSGRRKFIQCTLSADRPVRGDTHPEAFDDFYKLNPDSQVGNCKASELAVYDNPKSGDPSNKLSFPEATRASTLCLVVRSDLDYYRDAIDIFFHEFEGTDQLQDSVACLSFSAVSGSAIRISNELGGTAPGWAEEDQCLLLLNNTWTCVEDDEAVLSMGKHCITRLREAAKAQNVLMPQIWMNNAGPDDDVIKSYGQESWTKLRDISFKYDPDRTFQRLCAGGYKIERQ